ncbi:MAG: hypothetical protein V3S08_09410, partial [Phycisphaerales bacterium]
MRNDKIQDQVPEIGVRIPGTWSCPASLEKALPPGYGITPGWLHLPDGDRLQVFPHAPDDEFAGIFATACRGVLPARERRNIKRYGVNVCLAGRGGSVEAAKRMMKAAAALVRAGGMGVFIDNSGTAHVGRDWLELEGDPDDGATFPAFVASYANG